MFSRFLWFSCPKCGLYKHGGPPHGLEACPEEMRRLEKELEHYELQVKLSSASIEASERRKIMDLDMGNMMSKLGKMTGQMLGEESEENG